MSDGRARRLARRSLGEEVTEAVRDMILRGELRGGELVTHDQIAALLDVSAMPAREALQRLSQEGLIESSATRRHRVAALTRDDLRDIYWVHGAIAGELTRKACLQRDTALVADLEGIIADWNAAEASGDAAALDSLNHSFHAAINRAADAPKLLVLLRHTLRLIPHHFYALVPTWSSVSARGHGAIVDALRDGDADTAERVAREHVLEAGELLTAYFVDTGYWEVPAGPPPRRRTI